MSEVLPGLRPRRKAAGLTLNDLAARLGLTSAAVGAWERGTALPTADRLPDIAAALDCRIEDLYEQYTNGQEVLP